MTHETEQHKMEELCEEIWALSEMGLCERQKVIDGSKIETANAVLEKMEREGIVSFEADRVALTGDGRRIARSIIRRHRLAETLFMQVLSMTDEASEATACEMEHVLSTSVTESVCSFLGHPLYCPHGKPIPPGRCCESFKDTFRPLVVKLLDLNVGEKGKVVFVRSQSHLRIDRVGALGLVPGAIIRLTQKQPAVVVEIGETTIALDRDIADEVSVHCLSDSQD